MNTYQTDRMIDPECKLVKAIASQGYISLSYQMFEDGQARI